MRTFVYIVCPGVERYSFSAYHPLRPERVTLSQELAQMLGVLHEEDIVQASPAAPELVAQVHSPRYVQVVQALSEGKHVPGYHEFGFASGDNPPFRGMFEASLAVVGASVAAAQAVMDGVEVAVNLAGGLHHARREEAAGFCIFNDPAVAIHVLKQKYRRIVYLDIDVHHGDGVQWLYYRDPQVLTISIHESGRFLFPGTGHPDEIGAGEGRGTSANIALGRYADDEIWWWAFQQVVPALFRWFQPEVVVLQMGADPHYTDPLAHVSLTTQGWLRAVQWVVEQGLPIVATGGGGYSLPAVTRMWTMALATLKGVPVPNQIPPQFALYDEVQTLRDSTPPALPERMVETSRQFTEQAVSELKQYLRPYVEWGDTFAKDGQVGS
ncbi:MAG: acetoin utilization protein AcuC [Chthonomonadetes bacterium]|nr:acetoin utilization protein AcuC [Chthonomonadetes bacterium]